MKPISQIFRKDVRHLWPRIAIVLAVELLIGWVSFATPPGLGNARPALSLLEGMAWWYLIASAIHEEAVPGNRQYWLTRPFARRDLLAAKLIFILAFTCLPLFLGQVASLMLRGTSPLAYLQEILVCQLFFLASAALPIAALASVTAGLVEFAGIWLAALAGYGVIISEVVAHAQNDFNWGGLEWCRSTVLAALALAAAAAILLLQYFRRRTWLSYCILAAAVLASALLRLAPGWRTAFALQTRLSEQHVTASVARIAFDPARDPRTAPGTTTMWGRGQNVSGVWIPVRVTGIPAGMALYSDRATATVGTPDGKTWTSDWDSMNKLSRVLAGTHVRTDERFLPSDGEYWLYLNIDRPFYRRTRSDAIHLHARVAVTLLSPERITPLALREGAQAIPNDGFCWVTRRERLLAADCLWPATAPARLEFRPRWRDANSGRDGEPGVTIGDPAGSYAPYPTSGDLWQWSLHGVIADAPPAAIDLATRRALAHFERDLDIPDLREWTAK
jgi:hypothetical protein